MERIPFSDFGGSGRTIIFLHGNGFPPDCYSPMLKILSENYHVIGMHSRTMWQKEVPTSILSWKIFADDLTRFIQENGLQDAILVGHSFGALSALRTLQNDALLENPLVMIDPVLVSPLGLLRLYIANLRNKTTLSHKLKQGALRRRRVFPSLESAALAYAIKPIFRNFSRENMSKFVEGLLEAMNGKFHLIISPEWEAKIYATAIYKDFDIFLKIPFFPRRSLVVWGAESDTFRKDAVQFLHFVNRNFIIKKIENATHLLPFEQPEKTARLILKNFIGDIMTELSYSSVELMIINAARLLRDGDVVFVGVGQPNLACNLAKRTHAPNLTLIYEAGVIGAEPERLPLSIGDPTLVTGSLSVVSMFDIFSLYLQKGNVDVGFLGGAQIDRYGNINATIIGSDYAHPKTRLPGSGGAQEIAAWANRCYIMTPHQIRRFPEKVDFLTSAGFMDGKDGRKKAGLRGSGPVCVVTDLGMMEPNEDGELVLTTLHPGKTIEQAKSNTGWDLKIAKDVKVSTEVSQKELDILRNELDPSGIYSK